MYDEKLVSQETKDLIKKGKTKFVDDFSEEVYTQTYRYGKEDINDTHFRIAKDLASVEADQEKWTREFVKILEDFKFVPGGRITSNAGTGLKGTTYINCFVDGFYGKDQDSMEGILSTLRRQALILKSEGGYGFCSDVMRPRGSFIGGIGNESPGSVRMLDMWDMQSAVITEGSGKKTKKEKAKIKIRKGAQMVTMSCWHPDVEEYIVSKQTPGRLTKFNMSVLITDDFMNAVNNNLPWNLEFPDYENVSDIYKDEWDGNLKKWKESGFPTVIYKTFENANELWDKIMTSTYTKNEPGVLFVDTMNNMNNLWYNEYISATNPCGEQILPIGGVCLLGSLNLTQFINSDSTDWDYEKLSEIIPICVRFMDNVNDKTHVPLESQKENLKNKRRIGLGIMGYGSALLMMKVRYGSDRGLELTEKLMSHISNTAYKASALISKEKGSFLLYDKEQYLKSNFIKVLDKDTIEMIEKYGLRNSHLLSIQPTGNSSIFANNVSGGLEPLFMFEYIRTSIFPYAPEGLTKPTSINWESKTYELESQSGHGEWTWTKEGDENLLRTDFGGYTWKFDRSRGLLRETMVKDYGVRYLEKSNEWNPDAEWAKNAMSLGIDDHVSTMKIMAKYIDSAMSKTVNLPSDYPYEDFKRLYMDMYKTGTIKGGTTYRAGTMTSVLSEAKDNKDEENGDKIQKTNSPKRPKELPCDVYHVSVKNEKWVVIIGLLSGDPYEVFAFKLHNLTIPVRYKTGKLIKIKKGRYDLELEDDFILQDVKTHFQSDEQEALTRMVSTSLRHGADIHFIVEQLMKSEGTIVSFSKAVARTLKRYIKDGVESSVACGECGSDKVVMQEGCYVCLDCGGSKCG
jgi:ribonucleoside-diphosphate reductase alpha chain